MTGTWDSRAVATADEKFIDISAKLQATGLCKPGGSTIAMFGTGSCAGFGAHTPWYNHTGMSTGWAFDLAAALHQDYGHEVLNVAQGDHRLSIKIGETANKLFEETVVPLQPDVVVISFGLLSQGLPTAFSEVAAQSVSELFLQGLRELVNLTVAIGALPVVCECYPYGTSKFYKDQNLLELKAMQYKVLKETNLRLEALGVPILPMLAAVEDGAGNFRKGFRCDSVAPNPAGHYLELHFSQRPRLQCYVIP